LVTKKGIDGHANVYDPRRTEMKTLLLMLATCLTFTTAQTAQASPQTSPDVPSPPLQQDSQPASLASSLNKGNRKITGCIRSENGKYLLESRQHQMIWLSGPEDFAPHAGHTVILYGNFLNGSTSAGATRANTGTAAGTSSNKQGTDFKVTKMEMVSDSCTLKSPKRNKNSSSDQH
jgi:hypothetical protein